MCVQLHQLKQMRKLETKLMLPTHSSLNIVAGKNSSTVLVSVKKDAEEYIFEELVDFFDANFKRLNKNNPVWPVPTEEIKDLIHEVDNILDELEEEEEESDDEMIQTALARRFKSQSSGKHIEEEKIDDSEDEDIVSVCRRLRHLYKVCEGLRKENEELHAQLKHTK